MSEQITINKEDLKIYQNMQFRRAMSLALMQYEGDRDLYNVLGYIENPTYKNFYQQYKRNSIATAIINKPVSGTWRGDFYIHTPEDLETDPLKEAWLQLEDSLSIKDKFRRVDTLASLGQYAVLLLGLSDVENEQGFAEPVQKGANLKLLYISPYSEEDAIMDTLETDATSKRFGLPKYYTIKTKAGKSLKVHHTRVIHVVHYNLEDDIYGIPTLEKVFNRLQDIEKIAGGDAEAYFRNARPGFGGKADDGYSLDDDVKKELENDIKEYEMNLRRFILTEGLDIKSLSQPIANPKENMDVQLSLIAAAADIPKRILTGSERGELASSQDRDAWHETLQGRREEIVEVSIVRPFALRLFEYSLLPHHKDWVVFWQPFYAGNEKDKAEVGRIRATAIKEYTQNPQAEEIVPIEMFFKYILNLGDDARLEMMQYMEDMNLKQDEDEIIEEEVIETEIQEEE
jgi:uncharacterized protein